MAKINYVSDDELYSVRYDIIVDQLGTTLTFNETQVEVPEDILDSDEETRLDWYGDYEVAEAHDDHLGYEMVDRFGEIVSNILYEICDTLVLDPTKEELETRQFLEKIDGAIVNFDEWIVTLNNGAEVPLPRSVYTQFSLRHV